MAPKSNIDLKFRCYTVSSNTCISVYTGSTLAELVDFLL